MPLYNRAGTVRRAVDSVLTQTFRDFELIVVDDGSTDAGPELVESTRDPRVRLLRLGQNRGGNVARNHGIIEARGRIISFLDSDDWFLPHKLQVVAATFEARPQLDGMLDSFRKTSRTGVEKECRNPRLRDRSQIRLALFHRRLWKSTPGISVTRAAALRAGLFDETLRAWQDYDFLLRILHTSDFVVLDTVTWVKTFSPDGITANVDGFMAALVDFWERHPSYYDDPRIRGAFAADLTRHLAKLVRQGRFRKLSQDAGVVARRIGWLNLSRSIPLGLAELLRLAAFRRRNSSRKRPPLAERAAEE